MTTHAVVAVVAAVVVVAVVVVVVMASGHQTLCHRASLALMVWRCLLRQWTARIA